jgi:mersacidin/lichenicidin family type 2 lantibiotic
MKFDIARAWKDEEYRQSLSEEQLSTLPTNPAGELTDDELADVAGGSFGVGGRGFGGVGGVGGLGGFGGGFFAQVRRESVAVICEINVFSVNIIANIAVLGSATQICAKG